MGRRSGATMGRGEAEPDFVARFEHISARAWMCDLDA
jgi:hypothetical protein